MVSSPKPSSMSLDAFFDTPSADAGRFSAASASTTEGPAAPSVPPNLWFGTKSFQKLVSPKAKVLEKAKAAPVVEEVPIPSDNWFMSEKKPEMVKSAFKRTQKRYKLKAKYSNSPLSELTMNKKEIEKVLKENLKEMRSLKFNRGMDITFEKIKDDYTKETLNHVWSSPQVLTDESQINETMQVAGDNLITRAHHFLRQGSNWQILSILLYNPLTGSCYIALPKEYDTLERG